MADYEMQESNLPNEEGKRVVYPRMILWGQTETKEIVENISKNSTFTTGEISGIIEPKSVIRDGVSTISNDRH